MKKLLTVSLFAIMAVSAANADIASTDYVGKQITATAGTLSTLTTTEKGNLVGAINSLKTYVDDEISTVDEGAGAMVDTVSNELAAYKTSNDTAVQAAQAAAEAAQADADANARAIAGLDTTYVSESEMSSFKTSNTGAIATAKSEAIEAAATDATTKANAAQAAAEAEVTALANGAVKSNTDAIAAMDTAYRAADTALDGRVDTLEADNTTNKSNISSLQTAVENLNTGTNSVSSQIATALEDYSTTAQMNSAIESADTALETKVTNAYKTADTALETSLKTYADTAEADAVAAAKTAGDGAYAVKSTETVASNNTTAINTINTNLGALAGVTIPEACATGRCALVMEGGEAKWETINY